MEGGTKGNLKNNFSKYRFLLLRIVEYDEKYLLEKNWFRKNISNHKL